LCSHTYFNSNIDKGQPVGSGGLGHTMRPSLDWL
jgi:hypothetical protein